jgi:NifB/MoaA-like Fe-S oxidoreductase
VAEGISEPPADQSTRATEIGIVTGEYGARVLAPLLPALRDVASVPVRLVTVPNRFFGGNIAVTGLLTGRDVSETLAAEPAGDRYLVPDVVLSRDRFLDGTTVTDLPRPVEIVPTDGASLVAALR